MNWDESEHPRDRRGRFRDKDAIGGWVEQLSERLSTPGDYMLRGHRAVQERFGVEIPEPTEGRTHGAPAESDLRTGAITYDPTRGGSLTHFRDKRISLGGTIGLPHDVWEEAGAHEATHALTHRRLSMEQQVEALRRGARAAGLPEPPGSEHMVGTYGWATSTEMESSPDFQQGSGLLTAALSRYASYSNFEALAEALTEYVLADEPRPFAQAVGDYVLGVLHG